MKHKNFPVFNCYEEDNFFSDKHVHTSVFRISTCIMHAMLRSSCLLINICLFYFVLSISFFLLSFLLSFLVGALSTLRDESKYIYIYIIVTRVINIFRLLMATTCKKLQGKRMAISLRVGLSR